MRYNVVPVDHTSASPLGYRRIFMVDLVKRRRFLLTRKENSVDDDEDKCTHCLLEEMSATYNEDIALEMSLGLDY